MKVKRYRFGILAHAALLALGLILINVSSTFSEPQGKCCPFSEPPAGINKGLPDKSIVWENLMEGSMEEHIFLIGFFDEGFEMFSTIFVFKYGPLLRYGYYSFLYENSTKKTWFASGECDEKARKLSHDSLNIECGDIIKFNGKWPNWTYKLNAREFQADLKFTAMIPSFDVGKCYYSPDKSVFIDTKVFNPRGKISGTLTTDGKVRNVGGNSYGDHNLMNTPPLKQGPFMLALRIFPDNKTPPGEQLYINVSSGKLHEKFGGGYDKYIFVARGSEIVGFTRNLDVQQVKVATHAESGYKYVQQASVKANGSNFNVTGMFTVDRVIESMDIYKFLPVWARRIAEKFWNRPIYFRFLGTFEGIVELDGKKIPVKQFTTAEMNFTQ